MKTEATLPAPEAAPSPPLRVAVIGAGWAGMAAALCAARAGHAVTVLEAARHLGGRARGLDLTLPDGRTVRADNGQHILIGAYSRCLALMREAGMAPESALLRLPLALMYADGSGLQLPDWPRAPAGLDAAWGIARARGWQWRERLALLRRALLWQRSGFACAPATSVADLCQGLPPRLLAEFIEPLCVSALNTPMHLASGQVFLRVLRDALFAQRNGSNLLLPRQDLGALFPDAAARHITRVYGAAVLTGQRVQSLQWQSGRWRLSGVTADAARQCFDRVVLATSAPHAAALLQRTLDAHAPTTDVADSLSARIAADMRRWQTVAEGLPHRAITTVYAQHDGTGPTLAAPMLALRSDTHAPAQFVFDRDAIVPDATPTRLLAFVISDSGSAGDDAAAPAAPVLAAQVTAQAQRQLGLRVQALRSITEKRATFACLPALQRPGPHIAAGVLACGDYVQGPYPATLEAAVQSGEQVAQALRGAPHA